MPIRHAVMHFIDKKPDGSPAALHLANHSLPTSEAIDGLLFDLNGTYNAKTGKAWGFFHGESGAYPLSGWLSKFVSGKMEFIEFTRIAVEHLTRLMEESNLTVGGHVLFAFYQQGMTEYLTIAILQQVETVTIGEDLTVSVSRHLDTNALQLAARINISEWKSNPASRQYISFIKSKGGRKASAYFADFLGCQEGVDGPSETRTLLKAFSDFVESEDMHEDIAREKTHTLVEYAASQIKIGEPITIDELSSLIDEDRPRAFFEHIRNKDYGLSAEIPADKRTLNQFRRYTGRAEGMSISFEAHLLGKRVEFDKENACLTIKGLPTQLMDQLKRASAA
ncbi:nucleoid-associated protein YejK [Pseudomonas sp. RP23018S]|uniref:nucleoid-associated protein YejK n=1 Tax=Pseudomonas sp. RP23018S TaxID=3096037 RepID=UPI002ACA1B39|nr:nucleoid-associated protein YejK [Pseudomonas sp. RP23018S]MDZ5601702.1 nucleoid-associated protein YejK [Pseudomonas sp. RP23018S]